MEVAAEPDRAVLSDGWPWERLTIVSASNMSCSRSPCLSVRYPRRQMTTRGRLRLHHLQEVTLAPRPTSVGAAFSANGCSRA